MIFNIVLCFSIICLYLLTRIGRANVKSKNRLFLVLSFIILFLLIATREMTVGNDTGNYLSFFEKCGLYEWDVLDKDTYYEGGFVVFNIILNLFNVSRRMFLVVLALMFCYAIYRFIKVNSKNYLLSILLFVNLLFFYQSMNIARQFMALSIILLIGFKFVKERSLMKFIATVIFASLFHVSAVFALMIYPLYYLRHSKRLLSIIIIGSIVTAVFLSQLYPIIATVLDKDTYYAGRIGDAKIGNFLAMLVYLSMYIFALIVVKEKRKKNYDFFLNILLFSAAICFVSINMSVLNRVSQYYAIFSIIALPNIIEGNIKESKLIVESLVIGLFMLYSSTIMISRPEWNTAYDYKTCLLQEEGYICE